MAFTTPSYSLVDLFGRIHRGELQLPDFQRSFSWDVDRIRSLIVTVLRGYPVGALLALDTRGEPMRFRPRPIEGSPAADVEPGLLLLDGQQRVTSLYHCFRSGGLVDTVDARNKKLTCRFFIDVRAAVSEDPMPDEAVFSVDPAGRTLSHFAPSLNRPLTDQAAWVEAGCVPVDALLGQGGTDVLIDMAAQSPDDLLRTAIKAFHHHIVAPLAGYDIPMIRLSRETARVGIGSIFAQANAAGLEMDVFELLTAVFATEDPDFSLIDDWAQVHARLQRHAALRDIDRKDFLSAVALLTTFHRGEGRVGGQREDILNLHVEDWRMAVPQLLDGFDEAADFLLQRCIFDRSTVPYSAQLIPLTVILTLLGETPEALSTTQSWDRLNQWFWSGVFGELYGASSVDIRCARDVVGVVAWIRGETQDVPKTVSDAEFVESRLFSVGEDSGVWRGFYSLLMARGAKDWRTGRTFDRWSFAELQPTFARMFPPAWCVSHGIDEVEADSVINRTPLGRRTEVMLEANDPARYLPRVESKSLMDAEEFDQLLTSHDLDPEMLHASDAREFFADRRERMIGMLEYALGRAVVRDVDNSDLRAGYEGPDAFLRR